LLPGAPATFREYDGKDASPNHIATQSYDDGYKDGTLSILANGLVIEIPHKRLALAS
jgi:hypothetical protein